MVSVVRWVFLSLCMVSSAAQAEPRLFSSGGGMGAYYHSFLLKSEPAGLNENQLATVRTVNNSGRVTDAEWVVNCNENFPQVVRPSGQSIALTLADAPPSATQTDHELWWAVCRKVFEKYSKGSLNALARLKPGDTGSFTNVAGHEVSFKVLPLGKAALVPSLVKIRLNEAGGAGKHEVVFVYCSVPTVQWSDMKWPVELSDAVDETNRVGRARVTASDAMYRLACRGEAQAVQIPSVVAKATTEVEQPSRPSGDQSQPKGIKKTATSGEGGTEGLPTAQPSPAVAEAALGAEQPPSASGDQGQKSEGTKTAQSSGESSGSTSGGGHTSWRGAYIGQSKADLVKSLSAKFQLSDGGSEGQIKAVEIDNKDAECGLFYLKDDVVNRMIFIPCFFSIDQSLSDREFAMILSDHYDIPSFEASEMSALYQKLSGGASVIYKGNTTHGESVTVSDGAVSIEPAPKGEF